MSEIVCPQCGHRFALNEQITAHIHSEWERAATHRLRRELRADEASKAELRVRKEFETALILKNEELEASSRKLTQLKKQLDSASQRASSQPAQELGIIRQDTLHDALAARFLRDTFRPIGRGQRGGDLVQIVRDSAGHNCGSILWESKRGYKAWSNGWVDKLRADQRREGCTLGVIVSDTLPDGESNFCAVGSALACDITAAPYLGFLLRERIIEVAAVRGARARRDELKGAVYDYVSGPFIELVQGILETAIKMKATVDKEKRAKAADWKQRELEIEKIILDLASMYGELRAIGAALPAVAELEIPGSPVSPQLARGD